MKFRIYVLALIFILIKADDYINSITLLPVRNGNKNLNLGKIYLVLNSIDMTQANMTINF